MEPVHLSRLAAVLVLLVFPVLVSCQMFPTTPQHTRSRVFDPKPSEHRLSNPDRRSSKIRNLYTSLQWWLNYLVSKKTKHGSKQDVWNEARRTLRREGVPEALTAVYEFSKRNKEEAESDIARRVFEFNRQFGLPLILTAMVLAGGGFICLVAIHMCYHNRIRTALLSQTEDDQQRAV